MQEVHDGSLKQFWCVQLETRSEGQQMESTVTGTYWEMREGEERIKQAQVSGLGDWGDCGAFPWTWNYRKI